MIFHHLFLSSPSFSIGNSEIQIDIRIHHRLLLLHICHLPSCLRRPRWSNRIKSMRDKRKEHFCLNFYFLGKVHIYFNLSAVWNLKKPFVMALLQKNWILMNTRWRHFVTAMKFGGGGGTDFDHWHCVRKVHLKISFVQKLFKCDTKS